MNRKEAENRQISVYWWNFGRKTEDYKGPAKGYLLKKDIKIRKKPKREFMYTISFSLCSISAKIDIHETDFVRVIDIAIITFNTLLGDKAQYINPYHHEYKLNWR